MVPLIPLHLYAGRSRGAGFSKAEAQAFERVILFSLVGFVALCCLTVAIILVYQHLRFGTPERVLSERIAMRVVDRKVSKSSCVRFVVLSDGHLHDCARASRAQAKQYVVGRDYLVTREIWQHKQGRYYEFPDLY